MATWANLSGWRPRLQTVKTSLPSPTTQTTTPYTHSDK
ncbi:hypothetical protein MHYP_G00275220, partial [Metynnis hypsauchen]